MANKLAGQKMKFTKARANYYQTGDEWEQQKQAQRMTEVLLWADAQGLTQDEITQGADVPDEVWRTKASVNKDVAMQESEDEHTEAQLRASVDAAVEQADYIEIGAGSGIVYAYGYACAPDRLKIGSCNSDPVSRIANQISTGTPDKPSLKLVIHSDNCRSLERALHNIFQVRGRKIAGAGAEWYLVSRDEIISAYQSVMADF